jgi:uncharacterized OB-fold protein
MTGSRRLDGWRCQRGHVFLHRHRECPACGERLSATRVGVEAHLRSCTTVRVNPSGEPFRLGIAVTREGASTLCVVEGRVRGSGYDAVRLAVDDGRFTARATRWPAARNSRERSATRADSQKS